MQLSTINEQFSTLLDAARMPHPSEEILTRVESTVRNALSGLYSYRLAVASPTQVQEYFRLLEAYSHDLASLGLPQRQALVREGLQLLRRIPVGTADM